MAPGRIAWLRGSDLGQASATMAAGQRDAQSPGRLQAAARGPLRSAGADQADAGGWPRSKETLNGIAAQLR